MKKTFKLPRVSDTFWWRKWPNWFSFLLQPKQEKTNIYKKTVSKEVHNILTKTWVLSVFPFFQGFIYDTGNGADKICVFSYGILNGKWWYFRVDPVQKNWLGMFSYLVVFNLHNWRISGGLKPNFYFWDRRLK